MEHDAPDTDMSPAKDMVTDMAAALAAGDRRTLARAITLVESSRPDHRARAVALLARLGEMTATSGRRALRLGLSGTPGVGKSTFIEAFGLHLTAMGLRVAVLAVDPSSARSGGSILGDKTRMEKLSRDPRAFIRPSPSQAQLGGVARRTRDVIALCEGAGYDIILVETVGVGQSETMVADMSDIFVLLLAPAGGDDLQGVKRGIMEMADLVLINKADGDLAAQARLTCADYTVAMKLLRRRPQDPKGFPRAQTVSAVTGDGLEAAWEAIKTLADWRRETGILEATRKEQARTAFRSEMATEMMARLSADPALATRMSTLEAEVTAGRLSPAAAAHAALEPLLAPLRGATPSPLAAAGHDGDFPAPTTPAANDKAP